MGAFDQAEFLKFVAALLALLNPLLGLPIFISMTDGFTAAERRRTAVVVTIAVAIIALLSVLIGEEILGVFGISVPAFRVAGGIIIFGIGLSMLNAEEPAKGDADAISEGQVKKKDIAIVPLAIPLMMGPGAIATSIVFAHELGGVQEAFTLVPAVLLVAALIGVTFWFAVPIANFVGPTVISVVSRVMAIVLAAIAIEMVLSGIGDAIDARYPHLLDAVSGAPSGH